jgi:hypothetical protein
MEILIAAVVIGLIGYWAYTNFNKEKPDGAHVLDTLTKPVEVVPPAPVAEPVKVEAVAPVLDTEAPVVKKPRAPAKPRAKKPPTT